MEMIERVAMAMWEVRRIKASEKGIDLEEWGEDGKWPKANHIMDEARAAIEAMREHLIQCATRDKEQAHYAAIEEIDAALSSGEPKADIA